MTRNHEIGRGRHLNKSAADMDDHLLTGILEDLRQLDGAALVIMSPAADQQELQAEPAEEDDVIAAALNCLDDSTVLEALMTDEKGAGQCDNQDADANLNKQPAEEDNSCSRWDKQQKGARGYCDVNTLAAFLNVTPRRVQMLVKRGIIPKGKKRGEYELIPAIHAYLDYLKKMIYHFSGSYARRGGQGYSQSLTMPEHPSLFDVFESDPGEP